MKTAWNQMDRRYRPLCNTQWVAFGVISVCVPPAAPDRRLLST